MIFRKSTAEDCSVLYRLVCRLEECSFAYEKFQCIYKSQLSDSHYYCLVCEEDEEVIGMLNMRFEQQLHHCERIAEIMEFIIDEGYRDKGIGKKMFIQAEKTAAKYGCVQVELVSNRRRKSAHRFYINEGMNQSHYGFTKKIVD